RRSSRPTGRDLLGVRDRVLEVEDDRVGAEASDLLQSARVVSGGKQQRAQRLLLPVDRRATPGHGAAESIFYFRWTLRLLPSRLRVISPRPNWRSSCSASVFARASSSPASGSRSRS